MNEQNGHNSIKSNITEQYEQDVLRAFRVWYRQSQPTINEASTQVSIIAQQAVSSLTMIQVILLLREHPEWTHQPQPSDADEKAITISGVARRHLSSTWRKPFRGKGFKPSRRTYFREKGEPMRRILFQGTTAVKVIHHYSHPKVEAEITPLLVVQDGKDAWGDDELHWGLILQCTPRTLLEEAGDPANALEPFEIDNTFSAWSNPIRWWRALQLIEAMPTLDHRNIGLHLWIATERPESDDDFDRGVIEELRNTLGEGYDYEEIMARPVPREITQLTVKLVDEGQDMHGVQYDLTDEIEAGTIRWSQELKRIGVSHPDYRRAMHAALEIVTARYEAHLFSYAAFRECPYTHARKEKGFIMLCIENCIYEAIERGIEEYGMDITTMLAILHEEIDCDDIQEELEKKHPHDREGCEPYVRPTPEERFTQAVTWYTEHFKEEAAAMLQKGELLETLHRLYDRWEKIPVTHPLVS